MGKKAGRLVKTSALTGDGSSSLSPPVQPHSSPTRSESPPCTPIPGKPSSSVSLPRRFTRSMSIPFASTKAPPSSTTSPLPPTESHSSPPPLPKSHPKRKHVSSDATPSSVPKKFKIPEPSVSEQNLSNAPFYSNDKLLRFQENVCRRPLWPEYRVKLKHFPRIKELIESRGWSLSVTHLQPPNENLVREFYANLDESILNRKSQFLYLAYIRGNRFRFAPSTISCVLKIKTITHPTFNDEYKPEFKVVGAEITGNPNFVWNGKELPVTVLSEFYRILHKIAMSNWWANSHISTINYNTARFLYALGTGVSIDLPTLMYDRIMSSASAKSIKHTLPYPSLINRVVNRGSPVVYEQDKLLPVPSIGKSFNPVHSKPLPLSVMDVSAVGASLMEDLPAATTVPSSSRDGAASTNWHSQLIATVTDLATSYARDQLRQRRFEKSVIDVLTAMANVLKESEASPAVHSQGIVSSSSADESDQHQPAPGLSPSPAAIDPSAGQSQPQMSAATPVPLSPDVQGAQGVSSSAGIDKEIDSWFQQGEDIGTGIQGESSHTAVVQGEPSNVAAVQGETSNVAPVSAPDGGDSRILGAPLVSYSSSD
ncbi:hypothetical protein CsatA_028397 [Cannabis sativa]